MNNNEGYTYIIITSLHKIGLYKIIYQRPYDYYCVNTSYDLLPPTFSLTFLSNQSPWTQIILIIGWWSSNTDYRPMIHYALYLLYLVATTLTPPPPTPPTVLYPFISLLQPFHLLLLVLSKYMHPCPFHHRVNHTPDHRSASIHSFNIGRVAIY